MRFTLTLFAWLFVSVLAAQAPRFLFNLQTGINTDLRGFDDVGAHYDASLHYRLAAQQSNAFVLGAGVSHNTYTRFVDYREGSNMFFSNIGELEGIKIDRIDAYLSIGCQFGVGPVYFKPHARLNFNLSGKYHYLYHTEASNFPEVWRIISYDQAEEVFSGEFGVPVENDGFIDTYTIDVNAPLSYQLGLDIILPINDRIQLGLHTGRNFMGQRTTIKEFRCQPGVECGGGLIWSANDQRIDQMTYALSGGLTF